MTWILKTKLDFIKTAIISSQDCLTHEIFKYVFAVFTPSSG